MLTLFLLQTAEHVRFRKRAELLEEEGLAALIMAFERNSYPMPEGSFRYQSLGSLTHRNYLKRILPFVRALGRIRAAARSSQAIYCFGLDMLLLGWLASLGLKRTLIYEVGDIREVLTGEGFKASLFRFLERFLLARTALLVVTSKAFVTGYFYGVQGFSALNYQVVENKLDQNWLKNLHPQEDLEVRHGLLRIGYFGVLRCRRSWEILKKAAAGGAGRLEVYIRGISRVIDLEEVGDQPYMIYGGPYVSPDELPDLYGQVDLVWACYPYQGSKTGNWQWAKTVRFYEACFFNKPMLVQAGTEDSRVVEEYDIGLTVDMNDDPGLVKERLYRISEVDLARWKRNLKNLPGDLYLHRDEHRRLAAQIRTISGSRESNNE